MFKHIQFYKAGSRSNQIVHLQDNNASTVCGLSIRARESFEGRPLPLVFEVQKAATCNRCRVRLLTRIRQNLRKVALANLEEIASKL